MENARSIVPNNGESTRLIGAVFAPLKQQIGQPVSLRTTVDITRFADRADDGLTRISIDQLLEVFN